MIFGWFDRWLKRRIDRRRRVVLQALADGRHLTGAQIMKLTGLSSGTVYPVLIVAEERASVYSFWGLAAREDGPRPRYYRLTEQGRRELKALQERQS